MNLACHNIQSVATVSSTRPAPRRGSAYLLILMVSMIVTLIGLSGLQLTRLQNRITTATGDTNEARVLAISAVDVGLLAVANDPAWRTTYTNDVWTTDVVLGAGSISFKFVDENDGKLDSGKDSAIRLYGRGVVDETVQMCSVELATLGPNLLTNPGFEAGKTDWYGYNNGLTPPTLTVLTSDPHGGSQYLRVSSRINWTAGAAQTLVPVLESGKTYQLVAWLRLASGGDKAGSALWIDSSFDPGEWLAPKARNVAKKWTKVTQILRPTWSGSLDLAILKLRTTKQTMDFFVDDVVLAELIADDRPLAGSWRWEVDP